MAGKIKRAKRVKPEKTPKEKASKAQMNIGVRLFGCAYLLYIVYTLILSAINKSSGISPTLAIIIAAVTLILALSVITLTVIEFVRGLKVGVYSEKAYIEADVDAALAMLDEEEEKAEIDAFEEKIDEDDDDDLWDDEDDDEADMWDEVEEDGDEDFEAEESEE